MMNGHETAWLVFVSSAVLLAYTYVGYPLLLALITGAISRNRKPVAGHDPLPAVSVVIAAFNEEAVIEKKIENTLACDYPGDCLEVIVVSDASTDGTDEIVRRCKDPRVRLIRVPARRGKTHAQNVGVANAHGEIIVFSDATTWYEKSALRRLVAEYGDPSIAAVSGRYHYVKQSVPSPIALGVITFWDYENLIKHYQAKIATLTGCSGCIYSVRAHLYEPLPDSSCSDLMLPLTLVRKGYRVGFAEQAVAFEYATASIPQEFRMRVRVITHGIRSMIDMRELLKFWKYSWISFQLFSHKILRWSVPFFLIGLLASSLALSSLPLIRLILAAQLLFYGLALCLPLAWRWKPLSLPGYFCVLNFAVFPSLVQVLRGNRFVVWNPGRRLSE